MGCIIAKLAAAHWNFETDILSCHNEFFLLHEGMVYDPRRDWNPLTPEELREKVFRRWSESEMISLLSYSLYTDAVATDSFRYVHTLGCCIGKRQNLDFLPYPYGNDNLHEGSSREEK